MRVPSVPSSLQQKGKKHEKISRVHWDTVLCVGLSILLLIGGILAYFWMFPSE